MSRIHSLDYLKLLMVGLVVFAHTHWMQNHRTIGWFMFGNGVMRIIVPMFCIISGYFFHKAVKRGDGLRWLGRVLALYAFWKLVYLPFWIVYVHDLPSLIKTLVLGYYHLWFMAGILFAGGAVLFLRRICGGEDARSELPVLVGVAAACAVIGLGLQFVNLSGLHYVGQLKYQNGAFICFPFFTMGYLISWRIGRRGWEGLPSRPVLTVAASLGIVLLAFEAWCAQSLWGVEIMLDIPLSAYFAAPSLFMLSLVVPMPQPPVRLDPISAMIYFMHVLVLEPAISLGIDGILPLMLLGLGIPTLVALAMGRLGLFGAGRAGGRPDGGRGQGARPVPATDRVPESPSGS